MDEDEALELLRLIDDMLLRAQEGQPGVGAAYLAVVKQLQKLTRNASLGT